VARAGYRQVDQERQRCSALELNRLGFVLDSRRAKEEQLQVGHVSITPAFEL
jgi:hypothetical protein